MKSIKEDEDIELEINSYGGDVFAGIDIMNTLRGHKGNVTITITGIAASAASIICMGANTLKAYSNTQLMLHNAWTYAQGNAKQLRKIADDLDSIGESVLASYTNRIDENKAKKLLDEETYLSAKKALEMGLIDEIVDAEPEEVESTIFENKAKEFNNSIKSSSDTSADIEKIVELVVAKITPQLQQQQNSEQEPEKPTPKVAAKRKGFFF
nr:MULTISPECIES: head maturation protease, ClpP-related [Bacillaceae]